jgi:hypothetical protein
MASVVQFVDSVAASPTVRLDLNSASSNLMVSAGGIDLSPPPFREAVASTLLQDGDQVAAGAFGNRVVKLPISLVYATSTDAGATVIQNLGRELNRPRNILKVQLHGATSPVFFRTFRAPSFVLSMLGLLLTANTEITLEIPAEPFGYGLLETPVSGVTVNADPAAGSNGGFVDVAGVKGDVESPAIIRWPSAAIADDRQAVFAVRRRGTPASAPFLFQAEAMTQGTNTTTQANDANFSGSGNNWSRCTFTTATMQTRLSLLDVGTAGVDLRGTYRVFLRYRRTSADAMNMRLFWGGDWQTIGNDPVAAEGSTNALVMADLGLVSIPAGDDPVTGTDGVELAVSDSFVLRLQAERLAGTGNMDFDFLLLVPADDRFAVVGWDDDSTSWTDHWILDANGTKASARDASGNVISGAAPFITGGLPMLSPNQTNRVVMLQSVRATDIAPLTTVSPVSVSYYPRYLTVRPAST